MNKLGCLGTVFLCIVLFMVGVAVPLTVITYIGAHMQTE